MISMAVLGLLAYLSLAVWVGGILFFTFVATPILNRSLARDDAAHAVRAILPSYYRFGAVCGGVFVTAIATRVVLSQAPEVRSGIETVTGSLMLALTLYEWRVVLPRLDSARVRVEGKDPTDHTALEQRYLGKLQTQSVRLNTTVILLGLACLALRLIGE